MISKIKNTAALYRNRLAKIDVNLKDEVQKSMRGEIHKELGPHLKAFQGHVDGLVQEFAETRKKNLDRRYLVAARATNGMKDLTLGESRLIDVIQSAPAPVLSGIIAENKVGAFHGLVRLALLNRADELTKPVKKVDGSAEYAEAHDGQKIGQVILDEVLGSEPVNLDGLRSGAAEIAETCQAMADLCEAAGDNPGFAKMYTKYAEEVTSQTQDAIEAFQGPLKAA